MKKNSNNNGGRKVDWIFGRHEDSIIPYLFYVLLLFLFFLFIVQLSFSECFLPLLTPRNSHIVCVFERKVTRHKFNYNFNISDTHFWSLQREMSTNFRWRGKLKGKIKIPVATNFIFFTTKIRNGWNSFLKHENMTKKLYKLYCLNTCFKNITSWITKLDLSIFFPTLLFVSILLVGNIFILRMLRSFFPLILLFNFGNDEREKGENENFFSYERDNVDLIESLLR